MSSKKNKFKIKKWLLNHPKINPFNNYFKMYSSSIRLLPTVMIVGFHKTATTSLHEYLIQHPNVIKPLRKEIGYFSVFFWRGEMWYRSHFSTVFSKFKLNRRKENFVVLDSDPNCSYHPYSPKRIRDRLPKIKLIFVLRNPIDRAWSDFNQDLNREYISNISFEEKIKEDEHDFDKMIKSLKSEKLQSDYFKEIQRPYLSIGKYVVHIKEWLKYFSREQILFLTTDELKSDLDGSLQKIFNFLNIPNQSILDLEKKNVGKYEKMNSKTREKLIEYYRPYNLELETLLNKKFNWDR
jgi:hypothetical protein